MSRVNVGVIGVGGFGALHLDVYQQMLGVEIVAISDTCEARLREVAQRYAVAHYYTDYQDLCARPDIDLVSVATPEAAHVGPVLAAAAGGKHILLEKPIATTCHDAQTIAEAAHRAGVFLMVGHILRFESHYATIKQMIDEDRLGPVLSIHARRNRPKRQHAIYGHRVHALLVNAIHDIDACLWYMQDRVVRVHGISRNTRGEGYPDLNWGILEFARGGVACLETHWLLPDRAGVTTDDAMRIMGGEGVAHLQLVPSPLTLWTQRGSTSTNTSYDAQYQSEVHGAIKEEITYFVDCVRENRPPMAVPTDQAIEALRIALALIESAELGNPLELVAKDA